MYCIKVEDGKERVRVRSYPNGFLPSYRAASLNGKGGRRLVVPGYVFILGRIGGSVRVPDAEWRIIEGLSDPRPTRIDPETGEIASGPLAEMPEMVTRIDRIHRSVQVRATVLGEERTWWVQAEEAARAEAPEKETEEKQMAEKQVFKEEEIQAALEKAEQVGIHAAGKELGIPWQTILGWSRKAGKGAEKAPKKAAAKGAAEGAVQVAKSGNPELDALRVEKALLEAENQKLKARVDQLQKALRELL